MSLVLSGLRRAESLTVDYRKIAEELQKRVEGEVRFDRIPRVLYSTDASMYEIEPIGECRGFRRQIQGYICKVQQGNNFQ